MSGGGNGGNYGYQAPQLNPPTYGPKPMDMGGMLPQTFTGSSAAAPVPDPSLSNPQQSYTPDPSLQQPYQQPNFMLPSTPGYFGANTSMGGFQPRMMDTGGMLPPGMQLPQAPQLPQTPPVMPQAPQLPSYLAAGTQYSPSDFNNIQANTAAFNSYGQDQNKGFVMSEKPMATSAPYTPSGLQPPNPIGRAPATPPGSGGSPFLPGGGPPPPPPQNPYPQGPYNPSAPQGPGFPPPQPTGQQQPGQSGYTLGGFGNPGGPNAYAPQWSPAARAYLVSQLNGGGGNMGRPAWATPSVLSGEYTDPNYLQTIQRLSGVPYTGG